MGWMTLLLACMKDGDLEANRSDFCGRDPTQNLRIEDRDCDGARTDIDCDDRDSKSTIKAIDADCDGVLKKDDCDDESFFMGIQILIGRFREKDLTRPPVQVRPRADYVHHEGCEIQ